MTLRLQSQDVPIRISDDGVALVAGTRVPLDTIVYAFDDGASVEEIVHRYPSLKLADVYQIIGYYLHHTDEVNAYLKERETFKEQVRQENERRFPQDGLRARLLNLQTGK